MKSILFLLLSLGTLSASAFECEILTSDKITDSSHKVDDTFSINMEEKLLRKAGALYTCQIENKLVSYWKVFGSSEVESIKIVESFEKCDLNDQPFYADGKRTCEAAKGVAVAQCISSGFSLGQCKEFSRSYYTVKAPNHKWGGDYCAVHVVGSCK